MEKIQFLIVLISALFIFTTGQAQENFIAGKIVSKPGDTLEGLINYQQWEKNPTTIQFKKEDHNQKQVLGINDINAFIVENDIY